MKSRIILLALGSVFMLLAMISCQNYKQDLVVDWRELNSTKYTVKYFQHNFNNFPTDSTMRLNAIDFAESSELITLDSNDIASLVHLISDSTNFSNGDCGTFALNAGMIVFDNNVVRGVVSIGCGYNQWKFEPFNPNCKWGSLNEKGFTLMTHLLDGINTKNKKSRSRN